MKIFLMLCVLLLGISFVPNSQFSAQAGRTAMGGAVGEECDCGSPAPPVCYNEFTWQQCNDNMRSQQPPDNKSQPTDVDTGSLGLLLLTTLYLFKRFI